MISHLLSSFSYWSLWQTKSRDNSPASTKWHDRNKQLLWHNVSSGQTTKLLHPSHPPVKLNCQVLFFFFVKHKKAGKNQTNQSYWQTWQTPFSWQGKQECRATRCGVKQSGELSGERKRESETVSERESEWERETESEWERRSVGLGEQGRLRRGAAETPALLGIRTDCTREVVPRLTRYKTTQSTTPFSTNHKQPSLNIINSNRGEKKACGGWGGIAGETVSLWGGPL